MFTMAHTIGAAVCCKCGTQMHPNAAQKCARCLESEIDITETLPKRVGIKHCPHCNTYSHPPNTKTKAHLESKELLTFCLTKLKTHLDKLNLRLVHAAFIYTEPHSKRIALRLTLQKQIIPASSVIFQKTHDVDFIVHDDICGPCLRARSNPDEWTSVVQLRQHVSHRRTFFYLEQLIIKHDAAEHAIKISPVKQGVDFFFDRHSHGEKFVAFLGKVAAVKVDEGKQLVSHDTKSNKPVYKYSYSVEICLICRDDLICLPRSVSASLGNFGPIVICHKVNDRVGLLDPFSLRHGYVDAKRYWGAPFKALLSSKQLVEYVVLDVVPVSCEFNVDGLKCVVADAQVARVSDFGKNDLIISTRTHLGGLLSAGDRAVGYDLRCANLNDVESEMYKGLVFPDVVLIRKIYEKKSGKKGKLRSLITENGAEGVDKNEEMSEYTKFLKDLEENPFSVFNLSLADNGEDVLLAMIDKFEGFELGDEVMKE